MARPRKDKPDYCYHKPSGRAYVRIAGQFVWLGKWGTQESRDKYDMTIGQWKASGRQAPAPVVRPRVSFAPAATGPTVTMAIEAYWDHAQGYYQKNGKPTDEVACIRVALRVWRAQYGDEPAAAFDSLKLLALREHMIGLGWARKTINDHVGRVKRCSSGSRPARSSRRRCSTSAPPSKGWKRGGARRERRTKRNPSRNISSTRSCRWFQSR